MPSLDPVHSGVCGLSARIRILKIHKMINNWLFLISLAKNIIYPNGPSKLSTVAPEQIWTVSKCVYIQANFFAFVQVSSVSKCFDDFVGMQGLALSSRNSYTGHHL